MQLTDFISQLFSHFLLVEVIGVEAEAVDEVAASTSLVFVLVLEWAKLVSKRLWMENLAQY